MIEKKILFFGFHNFSLRMQALSLQKTLAEKGYTSLLVGKEQYGKTIAEIVLEKPDEMMECGEGQEQELPGSFLLFCGMAGDELDRALNLCRGQIRAVLTPSNSRMTVRQLFEELMAEKRFYSQK